MTDRSPAYFAAAYQRRKAARNRRCACGVLLSPHSKSSACHTCAALGSPGLAAAIQRAQAARRARFEYGEQGGR